MIFGIIIIILVGVICCSGSEDDKQSSQKPPTKINFVRSYDFDECEYNYNWDDSWDDKWLHQGIYADDYNPHEGYTDYDSSGDDDFRE